jgi:hypothetical protein
MNNFIKEHQLFNGIVFSTYCADRTRGKSYKIFFNKTPPDTIYSPTWGEAMKQNPSFDGVTFLTIMRGNDLFVHFYFDISDEQEDALDFLYATHVAPVPVWQ